MKKLVSIILCSLTLTLTANVAQADNIKVQTQQSLNCDAGALKKFMKKHPVFTKTIITGVIATIILGGGYGLDNSGWAWEKGKLTNGAKNIGTKGYNKVANLEIWSKVATKWNDAKVGEKFKAAPGASKEWIKNNRMATGIIAAAIVILGGMTIETIVRKENCIINQIYNKLIGRKDNAEEVVSEEALLVETETV